VTDDVKPAFDPTQPFQPADSKPAFDPAQPFQPAPQAAAGPQPSSLVEGVKGLARGAAGFAGDMGEAVMGPFGPSHHAGNLMADLGFGQKPAPTPGYGQQIAHATGIEKSPDASTAGDYAGTVGEFLGNPSTYFGPGGWLRKMIMGTAGGVGSEGAGQLAHANAPALEPAARTVGALAAGPVAARVLKPQLAPAQQMLADRGVTQMTPGQLTGGFLKDAEDKLTSLPILGNFIQNSRGRSIESFNRSVANQALEPIGETVPKNIKAGHDLVDHVENKLSDAYDALKPKLTFMPDRQFALDLSNVRGDMNLAAQPQIDQFERIINNKLGPNRWDRTFTPPGSGPIRAMSGEQFKKIESEFTKLAKDYSSSADASQRTLGTGLSDLVRSMRQNLERSNPQHAQELADINRGYAMFVRMQGAAGNRRTSAGVFTPSDLLAAVKRGDSSVRKGSFARGDALMQDYADAGQKVLPSKVPDSGTPGRAMTSLIASGGLGYLSPKVLAGVGAASLPYTRPSMALLNRYVRPTTGVRADYSNVGRGMGTVRPFLQSSPYGDGQQGPYSQ
jgi:hypothetical protein